MHYLTDAVQRIAAWRTARAAGDLVAVAVLLALTLVASWELVVGGTAIGMDAATFFYPLYSLLGQRLRDGDLPGWNPYSLSGAPFAADPQSGWMYLPAMLLFTLFSLSTAAKAYTVFHLLLAGLGTYGLARAVRLGPAAALVAAAAYEFNTFQYDRAVKCFACSGASAWLPVILLGAELAIRTEGWRRRALAWGVAGFAISQVLAVWLGQGAYYDLMALGGYVLFRTLISPPKHAAALRRRPVWFAVHSVSILAFGFAFGAAGLLPRIEYNLLSTLAGGYSRSVHIAGGFGPSRWSLLLTRDRSLYIGVVVLVLCVAALAASRGRRGAAYWACLALGPLMLARSLNTPLHQALYALLPGFEQLHPHVPDRILLVMYLGLAMLAGIGVQLLTESAAPARRAAAAVLVGLGTAWLIYDWEGLGPSPLTLAAAVAAIGLVCACAHTGFTRRRQLAAPLFVVLVAADLLLADHGVYQRLMQDTGPAAIQKVNLEAYYKPPDSAGFIQRAQTNGLWRYYGFDPRIGGVAKPYQTRFQDPRAAQLLVNNRSSVFGLYDVQAYNPVRLRRYDEYITALNAKQHGYREAYVRTDGLNSPLLDLLGVGYIVAPSHAPPTRPDLQELITNNTIVQFRDDAAVLENPNAVPRAWLVHEARQVARGEALRLLTTRQVDPRKVALLEVAPPKLSTAKNAGLREEARITLYEPERVRIQTVARTGAMLVLSDMYYPAWRAYVDGSPTQIYVTDHTFRSVFVPRGSHLVEFRYESAWLTVGLFTTAAALLLVLALIEAELALFRRFRGALALSPERVQI